MGLHSAIFEIRYMPLTSRREPMAVYASHEICPLMQWHDTKTKHWPRYGRQYHGYFVTDTDLFDAGRLKTRPLPYRFPQQRFGTSCL